MLYLYEFRCYICSKGIFSCTCTGIVRTRILLVVLVVPAITIRATTNAEKNHVASPPIFSKEGKIVKDTALYPGSAAVLEYGVLV